MQTENEFTEQTRALLAFAVAACKVLNANHETIGAEFHRVLADARRYRQVVEHPTDARYLLGVMTLNKGGKTMLDATLDSFDLYSKIEARARERAALAAST